MLQAAAHALRFNSRPREAGDKDSLVVVAFLETFQFTPARGGRPIRVKRGAAMTVVSIHARARRATLCAVGSALRNAMFQFTPARGGRRAALKSRAAFMLFQFTPARGGRHKAEERQGEEMKFQFTPARGGRLDLKFQRVVLLIVSIHARARRATSATVAGSISLKFQFTPARGGRRQPRLRRFFRTSFNSRPREAGDSASAVGARHRRVSIHARARRATFQPGQMCLGL